MSGPILIAAGGTGGHMFPALALGRALAQRGRAVTLVTDSRGARYVQGELPYTIVSAGSPSGGILASLKGIGQLARGLGSEPDGACAAPGRPLPRPSAATPRCRPRSPPP